MTMSSPFFFRQRRVLVSVLTVAAVVFSPAPIVAQPISRLFLETPKPSGVLGSPKPSGVLGSKEFGKNLGSWGEDLGSTLGVWTRDHLFRPPKGDYGSFGRK
jgi:hypothetical protein